ncbi:MAG: hypothetical protein ACNS61_07410 [Candidatus Wenzhouxiangella sp. M2_3B_020]
MDRRTATFRIVTRLLAAVAAVSVLGGCVSYYERHYGGSGVYYGGYETQRHAYREPLYQPVNPVHYPYWSIDYFYFSQYHHPYSFYVGYHEPLYYPYPGWALGYRHYPRYRHYSGGLAFGYPWYGFGHHYPRYSLGFFVGYGGHGGYHGYHDRRHRIRHIDQRLYELQQPARTVSRRALVGNRDNRYAGRGGIPLRDGRRHGRGDDRNDFYGSARISRGTSRSSLLRGRSDSVPVRSTDRDTRPSDAARSNRSRRDLLRRSDADGAAARSGRSAESRSVPRREIRDSRDIRRAPSRESAPVRNRKQPPRIQPEPDRTRRSILRRSSRGDAAPAASGRPPSARVPDRSSHRMPSRSSAAPSPRSRPSPSPRSRPSPPPRPRASSKQSRSGDGGRRALLRGRGDDGGNRRDRR